MEPVNYLSKSITELKNAKYLLSTSYKILKQPKALLSVSNHVFDSFMLSVSALLSHEKNKKSIQPYHNNTESKLNRFKELSKKYSLQKYESTINEIMNLSKEHKEAPVEFSRDGKYVLCSEQFKSIKTVSESDVKNYINSASEFLIQVQRLTANE